MSEIEAWDGTITPIELNGQDIESWIKEKMNNEPLPDWASDYQEFFMDKFYKEYTIYRDKPYKIQKKEIDTQDFVIANKNEDDSINFSVSFYNGGVSFDEIMHEVIKKTEN